MYQDVVDAESRWTEPMNEFAMTVLAMGYQPSQCLIEHQRARDWSIEHGSEETRRFLVLGKACFEVRTVRSPMVDCKWTITHTPRLICWPEPPAVA